MPSKIVFTDISKPKHIIPSVIGTVLCLAFGILIVTSDGPAPWFYIVPAIIGISLIAIPQIKNIRQSHTVRYNNTGLTAKLVGYKTFGFEYDSISSSCLNEKSLEIKLKNQDEVITLSRKRYNEQSLLQLKEIIENKKS